MTLQLRVRHAHESVDSLVISVCEYLRIRVQPHYHGQAGRRGRDSKQFQVGSVRLETEYRPPNVSGVEPGMPDATLGLLIQGNGVVDCQDRFGAAVLLQVEEIAKHLFMEMKAVDEAEVYRATAEQDAQLPSSEAFI